MLYINKFNSSGDVQTALQNGTLLKPYLAIVGNSVDYNSQSTEIDYSTHYLTFNVISGGNITWSAPYESSLTRTISYSTDSGSTWSSITATESGVNIPVSSGDVVMFKGTNTEYCDDDDDCCIFGGTAQFEAEGNIMSLLYGDNFSGQTVLPVTTNETGQTFHNLFLNCTGLTSVENLILPATTLRFMCYACMFSGCTQITKAPELPATTLESGCYDYMFEECENLEYIKCLATTIDSNYTYEWVQGVAETGTFVKASSASWTTGIDGIPSGWTVENAS